MAAAYYSVPYFIDKEAIKAELSTAFKSLTGFELEIQGEAIIERFPTPHVVVNSMYVHNAQGGVAPFLLTVKVVEIWPSYRSLLTKHVTIEKIHIDDVDLEIERLKSGQMNWKDSTVQTSAPTSVSQFTSDTNSGLVGARVSLTNGYVRYADEVTSNSSEYKDISLDFLNGGIQSESTLAVGMHFRDKPLTITGRLGSIPHALSVGEVPANLVIVSGKSEMNYSGNAGYKNGSPVINGSVKFTTDDIISWVSTMLASTDKDVQDDSGYKPLPLSAKSDIVTENGKIIFPNIALNGAIVKGGAHVEISPPYGVDIKALLNILDLEALLASKLFALKPSVDPIKEAMATKEATFIMTQKTFFESLNLSVDVKIDDTLYNQQHFKDSHVTLDMTNGEMTISQAVATLPGDTRVVFAGIGKEGYQGFVLEGEVDASGADFSEAVKVLKGNGASFPTEDFKRFRLKANALLSSKELRLSEIAARIENMAFLGGVISTFGDRVKIEASMRVGGLNFDHFIRLWGIQEWRTSLFDTTPDAKYDSFLARWLRRLDYDASMNLSIEQFILNGAARDKAELRLMATSGRVLLDDVKTSYNGSNLSGSFMLDVTGPLPKMEIKASADTLDTDKFFASDDKFSPSIPATAATPVAVSAQPPADITPGPHWSHQKFDFHWLELLNVTFHFKFDEYKQGILVAHGLDVLGSVENQALNIEALTGYVQGAQVAAKANIMGGAIPSINFAANISSFDPVQLLPFLPVLQGMTGKYNLSLTLDASGIDLYSWVASLEGSIGLGGENVNIHGFNLASVIHSISYVRTVADILNVVRRAFPGGDTMFTTIEGQWTVAGGVLKTSNSKLSNEQADGVLTCQVDLINWLMQSSISLSLKTLDSVHPPSMIITFNGSLDHPETSLDTRSLEQYVTNKTSERMLQEYGTQ
jgi:uncharacterized protein involved in outer membrane biogenesis